MGKDSKISWTTHTYNPWIGCHKVSPGCKHCYAETLVMRMGRVFSIVRRAAPATFNAPLKWKTPKIRDFPEVPTYVFTCSLSDFFHEDADPWRDEAWEIIRRTPNLTYQILTKRPGRIAEHLPNPDLCFLCGSRNLFDDGGICSLSSDGHFYWPWPNVWLGTSVENQIYAEKRISQLVNVPAVVHFLSCEPLLGPIYFGFQSERVPWDGVPGRAYDAVRLGLLRHIEWVIVGGESGPDYRKMEIEWARSIRDQCQAAGVPFWYKQGSARFPEEDTKLDGREWRGVPDGIRSQRLNRRSSPV